ncbi:lysylphosphatidylglycerol synthase domain-containing protein [Ciceribacter sp. L1K22]|uniref:lysylphosphatidylglycerol synthase domain-containing protein n=1 Tax=Ciceribacter sp. L1K22 TaxID=2820275 RepID=UPI001ABDD8FE|nr:lysylphosphatidylglycerol synthase domain-containing protein [Ciceribacter sp. L1K22]MBO3759724.1 UPF0104 family protein [Ciceribacter sp. L1K22]
MGFKKYLWPAVATATIAVSGWLLYKELRGLSVEELGDSLGAITPGGWFLCGVSAVISYMALAGYDRIALAHLDRHVNWLFITVCSFTTYALSHNVGASVLSGGVVRYRAYSSKGLNGAEIGILIAFCSFTFALGTILLAGVVLIVDPSIMERFGDALPLRATAATGYGLLTLVAIYFVGSFLKVRTLTLGPVRMAYPAPRIILSQLLIGPLELIGAAGIIYFALPEVGNPGFVIVLGIFLVSFSAALISHVPGGLGVLELIFIMGLPDMDPADVIAALLVFRLFYLIIPFAMALGVIGFFEHSQFRLKKKTQSDDVSKN